MPKAQPLLPIVIGTSNLGKVKEITALLADPTHTYLALSALPKLDPQLLNIPETGTTFTQNALIKAKTIGDKLNLPTIAEDSGLSVAALNGRPGVYSHRYGTSDPDRIRKLLLELKNIPPANRQAQFLCVAVYYHPQTQLTFISRGRVKGFITSKPKGESGFGYDPIFYSLELKKTFAQASLEEKNLVSHRRRAFEKLKTKY